MTSPFVNSVLAGVRRADVLAVSTDDWPLPPSDTFSDTFQLIATETTSSSTGCRKDTDCKRTRVCDDDVCTEANSAPTQSGNDTHKELDLLTPDFQLIDAERDLARLQRAKTIGTILYIASGVFLIPAASLLIYWIGDDVTPISIPIMGASFGVASVASLVGGTLVYPSQSEFDAEEAKIRILRQMSSRTPGNPDIFSFRLAFKF